MRGQQPFEVRAGSAMADEQIKQDRILDTLDAGAMGEVYLAKDMQLERQVAIKLLPEEFADDTERR